MTDTPYRQTTETRPLLSLLEKHSACREARIWASGRTVSEDSWLACERGDWLLWIAARLGVERRLVVLAACDCARLALAHVPEGEARPRLAIEVAERWARGEATVKEVRDAAYAAYAADYYADHAATAYAAAAAKAAANAADTTAFADYSAAYAANAVAYAANAVAYYAAYSTVRTATLRTCADLVRARIPWATVAERIEAHRG